MLSFWGGRQRLVFRLLSLAVPAAVTARAFMTGGGVVDQVPAAVLAGILLAAGPARMEVSVDPDGVTVRNLLTRTRVPWSDVAGLDEGVTFPWVPMLRRHSAPDVALWCLADDPLLNPGRGRQQLRNAVCALEASMRAVATGRPQLFPTKAPAVADRGQPAAVLDGPAAAHGESVPSR